jgi:recombination protein RecT
MKKLDLIFSGPRRPGNVTPQNETSTAVARSQKDIQALLESDQFKRAVTSALPKHMTSERFIRVALTAMMRTPALRLCTQESLFKCLLDCSALGLEPDGRRAHLIPYGKECTLIIDYKGIADLVRRSGDVSYIHADVVYERDEFDYSFGSGAFLKHKPNLDDRGERIKAFYSFVLLKDGSEDFIVMSKSDVDKVRKRSRASSNGPWVTDYDEMGKKTAFRRHSKWLPLSPETRDAVEKDDDAIEGRLAETPDGDAAWLAPGSAKAAEEVAEAKMAQMEAAESARARKGFLPNETPAEREARQQEQFARDLQQQGQGAQQRPNSPAATSPAAAAQTYDRSTLPDAMSVRANTECLFRDGDVLRMVRAEAREGDTAEWVTVEEVSQKPKGAEPPQANGEATQQQPRREAPKFGRVSK